uniref:Uncharacterized protein n=1 Tax=Triticum urartu TaxID=4572 RepID=A0A8R7R3Z3_TRIUA
MAMEIQHIERWKRFVHCGLRVLVLLVDSSCYVGHRSAVICDLKATDDSISISARRELFSTMLTTGKGKIQSAVPSMNKVMQINILLCLCYEVA